MATEAECKSRFYSKVEPRNGCLEWVGATNKDGYGCFRYQGKTASAHRLAYYWSHGHIPKGLDVDHECNNRACVYVGHLRAVTHRENVIRSSLPAAVTHRTGICKNGHDRTEVGTTNGGACLACKRDYQRRRYREDPEFRAKARAASDAWGRANRLRRNAKRAERRRWRKQNDPEYRERQREYERNRKRRKKGDGQ